MKNFVERILENVFGLVKVTRLNECETERNEYITLFRDNQKGYLKSLDKNKKLEEKLERVKSFWSDEEYDEIKLIETNLFELGLNAEYSDDFNVRTRERELVNSAYEKFRASLEKGIIPYDLKNYQV